MLQLLKRNLEQWWLLTDIEWKMICDKTQFLKVKKHQFLQTAHAGPLYECFVLKGGFKTYILTEKGEENILFFPFANEWVCDIEAFYYNKPARFNIRAVEDSEVAVINLNEKNELFKKIPKLQQFHIRMIEKSNLALQERLIDMLHKTARERYADFVTRHPQKQRKISDKDLSSYLGVTKEFLCKIKKEYSRKAFDIKPKSPKTPGKLYCVISGIFLFINTLYT